MKILAIESSGLVASVALWSDGCLIGEFTTNFKKTHSQTLLPMLDQLMTTIGVELSECDAIAVSAGPGSFTGLRIGSATAKGLGLALDLPIIEVPTVDGIAYNLFGTDRVVCPLMDAKRQQVYTGLYTFDNDKMAVLSSQKAVSITRILEEINALGRPVILTATVFLYIKRSLNRTAVCLIVLLRPAQQPSGQVPLPALQRYTGRIRRSM